MILHEIEMNFGAEKEMKKTRVPLLFGFRKPLLLVVKVVPRVRIERVELGVKGFFIGSSGVGDAGELKKTGIEGWNIL